MEEIAVSTNTREERFPWAHIPEAQLTIAELAADMIQNGGDELDTKYLIMAALQHERRRQFPNHPRDPAEREADVKSFASQRLNATYTKLARTWPKPKPELADPEPANTIREMIRQNIRATLAHRFEEFMQFADPMDIWLLREVLINFQSRYELGEAFAECLDGSFTYIRVRSDDSAKVEEFVNTLQG